MKSSLLSAKKCRAIMLLRSRMHCLSPSDKPNIGSGIGRKGTPPRLLSTKECKKLDNTLCGGPAGQWEMVRKFSSAYKKEKVSINHPLIYLGLQLGASFKALAFGMGFLRKSREG